jgi:hypothetical protein
MNGNSNVGGANGSANGNLNTGNGNGNQNGNSNVGDFNGSGNGSVNTGNGNGNQNGNQNVGGSNGGVNGSFNVGNGNGGFNGNFNNGNFNGGMNGNNKMYELEVRYGLAVRPAACEISLPVDTIVERTAEMKVVRYDPLYGGAVFLDVRLVALLRHRDRVVIRSRALARACHGRLLGR